MNDSVNWFEYVGYLASVLIIISFLVGNNINKIRWINMFGCFCFIVYGVLMYIKTENGIPIIITNAFIAIIQVYYLFFKKSKIETKYSS